MNGNYTSEITVRRSTEFLNGVTEKEGDKNTDNIHLDIEIVEIAIASLKNGTTCGKGGAQTELIKYGTRKLFNLLRSLFERCLNGDEVPETWKTGLISVIDKKGRKDECKNYRGITVMNTFSRVYGNIIKYYLEESYKKRNRDPGRLPS